MKIIDIKLFHEESFVEEKITEVKLDLDKKNMSIELDGGDLSNEYYLKKAKIVIEDWYTLDVVERDSHGIRKISNYPIENFSICEFHYNDNELRLIDVGNKCWVDWIFTKPKVTIYGEIDPNPPKFS